MKPHVLNAEHQPESFEFTKANKEEIKDILSRYPAGKQKSAVMPLLDLVQKQVAEEGAQANPPYGGWIPRAAMDVIADIIGEPPMKVYEVATFYTMYKLAPLGKFNIQVCGTTPCWLRGSKDIQGACEKHLGIKTGESTKDGMFSLEEVECLGACVNAPMIQVNKDDYFEDLTPERMVEILDMLKAGKRDEIPVGSQIGRKNSMAITGATTLKTTANDTKPAKKPVAKKTPAKKGKVKK
ncbi:MAG: NADH-quinone oxidoreductase subunit NuoE [Micavibrio sp.]|nr:NADH-quinone oxidoreductase subunit NuoE [Micavibrio sp.]